MKCYALVASALACLAFAMTGTAPAMAADTTLDLIGLAAPAFEIALTLGAAVALWLGRKAIDAFRERTGLELDEQQKNRIDGALLQAIQFGKGRVRKVLPDKGIEIDVRSEVLKHAIIYAQESVPDALAYFEIDQARLFDMLEARLGVDLDLDGDIAGKPA